MHSTSSVNIDRGAGVKGNQDVTVKSAKLQLNLFYCAFTKRLYNSRILTLQLSLCYSLICFVCLICYIAVFFVI